jgi:hypothetical protein
MSLVVQDVQATVQDGAASQRTQEAGAGADARRPPSEAELTRRLLADLQRLERRAARVSAT